MTPEHCTREHLEATDPLRAALEDIANRATVERNPDGEDQAAWTMQEIAREALAATPEPEWEYRAVSGRLLSRVARTVPEAQRLAETINFYPLTRIERRRKAGEWEALPDDQ